MEMLSGTKPAFTRDVRTASERWKLILCVLFAEFTSVLAAD